MFKQMLSFFFINQTLPHKGNSHFWGNILIFFSRTEMLKIEDGTTQPRTEEYPVVYAIHLLAGTISIGTTFMRKDKS